MFWTQIAVPIHGTEWMNQLVISSRPLCSSETPLGIPMVTPLPELQKGLAGAECLALKCELWGGWSDVNLFS